MPGLKTAIQYLALRTLIRGHSLAGDPYANLITLSPDRDPYPMYEKVRAKGDVVHSRLGAWVTANRELCDSALRDNRFITATFD